MKARIIPSARVDSSMKLALFQVDAFAERVFAGNPAAVIPLDRWLPDATMLAIAIENNLSETAYFVAEGKNYALRWFTPGGEVDLCGHATLATAHVLYTDLGEASPELVFTTRSGELRVRQTEHGYAMDFPAQAPRAPRDEEQGAVDAVLAALGGSPHTVLLSEDWIAVYETQAEVAALHPQMEALAALGLRGVLATAPGEQHDFVSRCFFPAYGIPEDPVTGSAHCQLTPYWAERLGKTELRARQISLRAGEVGCTLMGDRVHLTGQAVSFLRGEIQLP
jgi:PhzF family phenazine biosynthesis protein